VVEKRKTPNPIMTETLAPAVHFTEWDIQLLYHFHSEATGRCIYRY
jgi:hypothetical protein